MLTWCLPEAIPRAVSLWDIILVIGEAWMAGDAPMVLGNCPGVESLISTHHSHWDTVERQEILSWVLGFGLNIKSPLVKPLLGYNNYTMIILGLFVELPLCAKCC